TGHHEKPLIAADWFSLVQENRPRPAWPGSAFILLTSGDRLPLRPAVTPRLADNRIVFRPAEPLRLDEGGELSVFAPFVGLIVRDIPEGIDKLEHFLARLQREERRHDVLFLTNGDRLEGSVKEIDAKGCAMTAEGQAVQTPWDRIAAVAFDTPHRALPRVKKG